MKVKCMSILAMYVKNFILFLIPYWHVAPVYPVAHVHV